MTRASLAAAALLAVSACVQVPNDVAEGVGFQHYETYQARRATLRGDALVPPETVRPPSPVTSSPVLSDAPIVTPARQSAAPAAAPATDPLAAIAASAIAEAEAEAGETAGAASTPSPVTTGAPTAPPPLPTAPRGTPGMSDEQSFDAVAARETIESDAERLARMQAERVEIAPTTLPTRAGDRPSIVAFALETTHSAGTRIYTRNPLNRGRHAESCRAFRAPDLAQEWFLANGGPTRDRRALDPDGDGFACDWNPDIYRAAARSAAD